MSGTTTTVTTPSPLPNPLTPMVFLPPDLAYQVTISAYILVGCSSVITWDILNNLKADYTLLSENSIKITTITYIASRLASLGYVLACMVFSTAPIGNCFHFEKILGWLFTTAIASTSLLFLFLVRAVFNRNTYVVLFFVFTWVAVVAGCLTTTQGDVAEEIGPTRYCINRSFASYVCTSVIIPVANDTLVFLAISWRLMQDSYYESLSLKDRVRMMVLGDCMPAFSRGLLKDGQLYYLTTVSVSLLTVIMLYVRGVPVGYKTMLTVPNIMLMNIMACRVFRNTKLGTIPENTISTIDFSTGPREDINTT